MRALSPMANYRVDAAQFSRAFTPVVTYKVDATHLKRAISIIAARSKFTAAEAINRAVYFVIQTARDMTKVTPIARIDSELQVISSPKVLKNGKLSRARDKQHDVIKARNMKPGKGRQGPIGVPLAVLIVQSQVLRVDTASRQPGMSRYNRLTGMRHARLQSPWKGVKRYLGATRMRAAISRLVKARHSSGGFFKSSWSAILQKLRPGLPKSYGGGTFGPPVDGGLGEVRPAYQSQTIPTCVVENRIGMEFGGKGNSTLAESRNRAMHRHLGPILQTAIDTQYHSGSASTSARGHSHGMID